MPDLPIHEPTGPSPAASPAVGEALTHLTQRRTTLITAATLTMLFLASLAIPAEQFAIDPSSWFPLYTTIEFIAIAISLMIFALGWNTAAELCGRTPTILAMAFLSIGLLDFAHVLSYAGMPDLITPANPEKAINFWLAARISAAITFLAIAITPWQQINQSHRRLLLLITALLYAGFWYWLVFYHTDWLPRTFIADTGMTDFRVGVEVIIVIVSVFTASLLWLNTTDLLRQNKTSEHNVATNWLACAVWVMALSELFFAQYNVNPDGFNLLGHVYKVIGYAIVYYALFVQNVTEPYQQLRRSQHQLQLSEARYSAIVTSAMDAIVMVDDSHRIILFNKAAETMFGFSVDEVLHQPLEKLLPKRLHAKHAGMIQTFANSGESVRQIGEYGRISGARKTGEEFPAEASISQTCANGTTCFTVILRDISRRKHAEAAILQSEHRFRTLISNLQGVVYRSEITAPWAATFISDGVKNVTGHNASQFMQEDGLNWSDFMLPDDIPMVDKTINDAIENHKQYELQYRIVHSSGNICWVHEKGIANYDEDGNPLFLDGFIYDITNIRQAEDKLQQNEQQFRLLAENINDVFWLMSPDHRIFYYISPAYETVWGRSCAEVYTHPASFFDAVHEDDEALTRGNSTTGSNQYKEHNQQEFRIIRPGGEIRWIISRYAPIFNKRGEIYRIAGVSEDITERKLAEQERRDRERQQRDTLVREVHHRIKNNLQGVIGLLRQHSYSEPLLKDIMETAIAQVNVMGLVHGLQSKEYGEDVQLNDMCVAIADNMFDPAGHNRKIQVTCHIKTPVSIIQDESVPVALVINELMYNAMKHADPDNNATIDVDISCASNSVKVIINNPGTSLPENFNLMENIGTGTGLTLVRALLPKNASAVLSGTDNIITTELLLSEPALKLPMECVANNKTARKHKAPNSTTKKRTSVV